MSEQDPNADFQSGKALALFVLPSIQEVQRRGSMTREDCQRFYAGFLAAIAGAMAADCGAAAAKVILEDVARVDVASLLERLN